jgi:hypothetical protein
VEIPDKYTVYRTIIRAMDAGVSTESDRGANQKRLEQNGLLYGSKKWQPPVLIVERCIAAIFRAARTVYE